MMKAQQTKRSLWIRAVYIFATLVTVFAQLGAAVPALVSDAASTGSVTLTPDKTSYSQTDDYAIVTVTDSASDNLLIAPPAGMTYDAAKTLDDADYNSSVVSVGKLGVKASVGFSDSGSVKVYFEIDHATYNGGSFTASLSGGDPIATATVSKSSTTTSDDNIFAMKLLDNGTGLYDIGDDVDIQMTVDLGTAASHEGQSGTYVGFNTMHLSKYMIWDKAKTEELAKDHGYTMTALGTSNGYVKFQFAKKDGSDTFQIWKQGADDNTGGEMRFYWAPGESGVHTAYIAFMAAATSFDTGLTGDALTLVPTFLSDTSALLHTYDGDGVSVQINKGQQLLEVPDTDEFLPNNYQFEANAIAGGTATLSSFPFFYIKSDAGTSILSDTNGKFSTDENRDLIRKAIAAQTPYSQAAWGPLSSSTSSNTAGYTPATFGEFYSFKDDGAVTSTGEPFVANKAYTLIPYSNAGGSRFKRIDSQYSGANYYMPDGAPTFTLDATGKMTLTDAGDGKAKKGQYQVAADGKKLTANLYKIKYVEVHDADSDAKLSGVTVKTTAMQATGGVDNATAAHTVQTTVGELRPSDYNDTNKGPFYLPDGTQTFASIDFGKNSGYAYTGNFSFDVGSDDKLALSADSTDTTVSADGQTLILKAHKAKNTLTIKKVDKADPTKALAGAQFNIAGVDNTTAFFNADKTTDANGAITITGDATLDAGKTQLVQVTEKQAPTGYKIGASAGYYAVWTAGTGFTAVGANDGSKTAPTTATSADKLASVSGGVLTIKDPSVNGGGSGGGYANGVFKFVDVAGNGIGGASLPVLADDATRSYADPALGFAGIGGVIYNGDHAPTNFMKSDSGIASGTLNHDSSMYTSTERSKADGTGHIQQLWAQNGLLGNWTSLNTASNAYRLSAAISNGIIPGDPAITYQLISPAQLRRATATPASGYYSMGGSVNISNDSGSWKIASANINKYHPTARDNRTGTPASNTVSAQLYKVKQVKIVDANGNPIQGATAQFGVSGKTDADLATGTGTGTDGYAELHPADATGKSTADTNFSYPDGTQGLLGVQNKNGSPLKVSADSGWGFTLYINSADELRQNKADSKQHLSIIDNGQTVLIKVDPVGGGVGANGTNGGILTVNKVAKGDATKKLDGAKYDIKEIVGSGVSGVSLSGLTTASGSVTADLGDATTKNRLFTITENVAPAGYQKDTTVYSLLIKPDGTMTIGGKDDASAITAQSYQNATILTPGTVQFTDEPETVTTGTFKLKKFADNGSDPLANAAFTLTDTTNNDKDYTLTSGTNGEATATIDTDDQTAVHVLKVTETAAPEGYATVDPFYVQWRADQNVIGIGTTASGTFTKSENGDKFVLSTVLGIIDKKTALTPATASFTIKKTDLNGDRSQGIPDDPQRVGGGAHFAVRQYAMNTAVTAPSNSGNDGTIVSGGDVYILNTGATSTITTDEFTTDKQVIGVSEGGAPEGYVRDSNWYYVTVSAEGKVVGVSQDPEVSTAQETDNHVLKIDDAHTLNFGDAKEVKAETKTITLRKIDKDTGATITDTKTKFGATLKQEGSTQATSIGGTIDAQGELKLPITGDLSKKWIIDISEAVAPADYAKNSEGYQIVLDNGKLFVRKGNTVDPTATTSDGVMAVKQDEADTVTFADSKTSSKYSFTIHKVDANNPDKALAGATFAVTDIAKNASTPFTTVTTDAQGNATVLFDIDPNVAQTKFKLVETNAPAGYNLASAGYLTISTSGTLSTLTVLQNAVNKTSDAALGSISSDRKTVTIKDKIKPVLNIQKVNAEDPSKSVTGASFRVSELNGDKKTVNSTGASDVLKAKTEGTVDDKGQLSIDLPYSKLADGTVKYLQLQETSAPGGYVGLARAYVITYKVGTGVTGIAVFGTDTASQTIKEDTSGATVTVTDSGIQVGNKRHADLVIHTQNNLKQTDNTTGAAVAGVKLTLSDPTTDKLVLDLKETDANGNVVVTPLQIAKALGLTAVPNTGSVVLRLNIDADAVGYTDTVSRTVTVNWTAKNFGFAKIANNDDSMVMDYASDSDIGSGNLRVALRKDTLRLLPAAADTSQSAKIGGTFMMTFYDSAGTKLGGGEIEVPNTGIALLPSPEELMNGKHIPVLMPLTVKLQAKSISAGYNYSTAEETLSYTSNSGYQILNSSTKPIMTNVAIKTQQLDPQSGMVVEPPVIETGLYSIEGWSDDKVVQTNIFAFGGSQIIFYVQEQSLNLDSAPMAFNFGAHTSLDAGKVLDLLPNGTDDEKIAHFGTDDTQTTAFDADQRIGVQVTQRGDYAGGWRLNLKVGALQSADGQHVLHDAQMTFKNGQGKLAGSDTTLTGQPVNVAMDDQTADNTTLIATGVNAKPGVYTLDWDIDDIKLDATQSDPDSNVEYRAAMEWNVTEAP